jgi:hypothetical protein
MNRTIFGVAMLLLSSCTPTANKTASGNLSEPYTPTKGDFVKLYLAPECEKTFWPNNDQTKDAETQMSFEFDKEDKSNRTLKISIDRFKKTSSQTLIDISLHLCLRAIEQLREKPGLDWLQMYVEDYDGTNKEFKILSENDVRKLLEKFRK